MCCLLLFVGAFAGVCWLLQLRVGCFVVGCVSSLFVVRCSWCSVCYSVLGLVVRCVFSVVCCVLRFVVLVVLSVDVC